MIEEMLSEISLNLTANIQDELEPGYGWITGDMHDSIQSNFKKTGKDTAVVEAYSEIYYTPFVNDGHTLRNGAWWNGYKFMEAGLDKTVAMYR